MSPIFRFFPFLVEIIAATLIYLCCLSSCPGKIQSWPYSVAERWWVWERKQCPKVVRQTDCVTAVVFVAVQFSTSVQSLAIIPWISQTEQQRARNENIISFAKIIKIITLCNTEKLRNNKILSYCSFCWPHLFLHGERDGITVLTQIMRQFCWSWEKWWSIGVTRLRFDGSTGADDLSELRLKAGVHYLLITQDRAEAELEQENTCILICVPPDFRAMPIKRCTLAKGLQRSKWEASTAERKGCAWCHYLSIIQPVQSVIAVCSPLG